MEQRKLKIRDLTMRDGQQSLFATRMPQSSIDRLLPLYENAVSRRVGVGPSAQGERGHERTLASVGPFSRS